MKRVALLVLWGLLIVACATGELSTSTTSTTERTSSSTTTASNPPSTTTSTTPESPGERFAGELPDGACEIDGAPAEGEVTVLVDGRLYGLGPDMTTPRCLVGSVGSAAIEWGPLADRVVIGSFVFTEGIEPVVLPDAKSFEWTTPTGTRVVLVNPESVVKVGLDGSADQIITFLDETEVVAYHPAGTHLLAVGTDVFGQYGMWFASNDGVNFTLIAFDEDATILEPAWSWLNEPLLVANHVDGRWHVHRVELVDGNFEGPIVVESTQAIDMLMPSPHDPVMLAYRSGGLHGTDCVDGSTATVNGAELPLPLGDYTSTPVGWLSAERLLILAYPNGCDESAELWSFSAGLCPGSIYGAELILRGVDGAAARQPVPSAPPAPDFTGIIEPAPA